MQLGCQVAGLYIVRTVGGTITGMERTSCEGIQRPDVLL